MFVSQTTKTVALRLGNAADIFRILKVYHCVLWVGRVCKNAYRCNCWFAPQILAANCISYAFPDVFTQHCPRVLAVHPHISPLLNGNDTGLYSHAMSRQVVFPTPFNHNSTIPLRLQSYQNSYIMYGPKARPV